VGTSISRGAKSHCSEIQGCIVQGGECEYCDEKIVEGYKAWCSLKKCKLMMGVVKRNCTRLSIVMGITGSAANLSSTSKNKEANTALWIH
jgi:hypothetical protein